MKFNFSSTKLVCTESAFEVIFSECVGSFVLFVASDTCEENWSKKLGYQGYTSNDDLHRKTFIEYDNQWLARNMIGRGL